MKVYYPRWHELYQKRLIGADKFNFTHKFCTKCNDVKPVKEFSGFDKRGGTNCNPFCTKCRRSYINLRYKSDIDKSHYRSIKRNYGITNLEYDLLVSHKNNSCYICGKPKEDNGYKLSVDHCHKTNKIRGLTCGACNSMLGYAKDNKEILQNAIKYLEDNGETVKRILGR